MSVLRTSSLFATLEMQNYRRIHGSDIDPSQPLATCIQDLGGDSNPGLEPLQPPQCDSRVHTLTEGVVQVRPNHDGPLYARSGPFGFGSSETN